MANIINGHTGNSEAESVCAEWKVTDGFKVNLVWKNIPVPVGDTPAPGDKNPYGSITDVPGIGPKASFCLHGNVNAMQKQYWVTLAGENDGGDIADPALYLRPLSHAKDAKNKATMICSSTSE